MSNEILEEVWRIRDEFAKRYDYDIGKMAAALREMEMQHPERMVDRSKKTAKPLHRNEASSE